MPAGRAIKPPFLLCLDPAKGRANRYGRVFDMSGAGLGWEAKALNVAEFDPAAELPAAALEHFRVTGVA